MDRKKLREANELVNEINHLERDYEDCFKCLTKLRDDLLSPCLVIGMVELKIGDYSCYVNLEDALTFMEEQTKKVKQQLSEKKQVFESI